jgi:hypothetical protein
MRAVELVPQSLGACADRRTKRTANSLTLSDAAHPVLLTGIVTRKRIRHQREFGGPTRLPPTYLGDLVYPSVRFASALSRASVQLSKREFHARR